MSFTFGFNKSKQAPHKLFCFLKENSDKDEEGFKDSLIAINNLNHKHNLHWAGQFNTAVLFTFIKLSSFEISFIN